MGSKRKYTPDFVQYQRPDGSLGQIQRSTYQGIMNTQSFIESNLQSGQISTLDRAELQDQLRNGLQTSTNNGYDYDTAQSVNDSVIAQAKDAIAGTAPKYRYRKYLDQVNQLQNDQPGQLQTVLSQSGPFSRSASILGGGGQL